MDQEQKGRRFGLRAKLNIMVIACILLVAIGLLMISYRIYCRRVDSMYFDLAERAAIYVSRDYIPYRYVSHLREMIDTDEFREVRARAVAADDPQIVEDWMRSQPPTDYEAESIAAAEADEEAWEQYAPYMEMYTLYGKYKSFAGFLNDARDAFHTSSIYLQYVEDGVTYNLVDPDQSLLEIGTAEEPIAVFSQYTGNDRIPATIYEYGDKRLCTACEPVWDNWNGEDVVCGQIGVDIDMSDVERERHWFLLNSALFIAGLTIAAIVASMLLIGKLATKPLKMLAEGATGFAKGDEGYSKDDVIRLPIRSNDEIGDLYHEIQFMQERIIDNTDKLTRITAERERVSTELRMASQIQNAMLPSRFPAFPDRSEFDLYASMEPAKEVGGDFYDFFLVDDDHLALVIADVSDKGVPAALFMMSAKIIINYRAQMGGTPGEILSSVNTQLCRDNEYKMFVTVWLGILELSTGRLICTNAGHEYPILKHPAGTFALLRDSHGIFMGVRKNVSFHEYELCLEPGSKLFLYTDGLAEANNEENEMFGMDRILQALNANPDRSPRELLETVQNAVDGFVRGAKQFDDLTMLCVEYKGGGRKSL